MGLFNPTYDGNDLGPFCYTTTDPEPNELQFTTYAGVNGMTSKNLGSRGNKTAIDGAMVGDVATLIALEAAMVALKKNAASATLTDALGRSWSNVLLTAFITREILPHPVYTFIRDYHAEFTHLTDT